MPLFGLGLVGLVTAIGLVATTEAGFGGVMLYVASTGFSLACFGTHNDTALALSQRSAPDSLSAALTQELQLELNQDRRATTALDATPKAAFAVTLGAVVLHLFAARWVLLAL